MLNIVRRGPFANNRQDYESLLVMLNIVRRGHVKVVGKRMTVFASYVKYCP